MSVWGETVASIINRVKDVIVWSSTGNNVENLPLDLLNRAQNWLCMYKSWDYLKKVVPLTISDNRTAQLPSDINVMLDIYSTLGDIGKPSIHYYPDAPDVAERCELFCDFTVTAGHSWYVQFPSEALVTGPLYLKYAYNLPDIEEPEPNVDTYTFFPGELLVRCAQKLHIEDKGLTGDSADLAIKGFNDTLRNFEVNSQFVNQKMTLGPTDKFGNPVRIPGHSLNGQGNSGYSPYPRATFFTNR